MKREEMKANTKRRTMEMVDLYNNTRFSVAEIGNMYGLSYSTTQGYISHSGLIKRRDPVYRTTKRASDIRKQLRLMIYRDKIEIDNVKVAEQLGITVNYLGKLLREITGIHQVKAVIEVDVRIQIIDLYLSGKTFTEIYEKLSDKASSGTVSKNIRIAKYITGELTDYYDTVINMYKVNKNVLHISKELKISQYNVSTIIHAHQYITTGELPTKQLPFNRANKNK